MPGQAARTALISARAQGSAAKVSRAVGVVGVHVVHHGGAGIATAMRAPRAASSTGGAGQRRVIAVAVEGGVQARVHGG